MKLVSRTVRLIHRETEGSLLAVQLQATQLAGQRQLVATALVKALGGGWGGDVR